jgi:hypothetical protein
MRPPPREVLACDRYWILPNRFAEQGRVSAWTVRAARIPTGRELVPFYWRRVERNLRRRKAHTGSVLRRAPS